MCSFRVYCTVCIYFAAKLHEFDKCLRAVETILVQNSPRAQTYAATFIGTKSFPTEHQQPASFSVHNGVADVIEQEKRKRKIVVFNLKTSQTGDMFRLTALFKYLTGSIYNCSSD